jgi:hypothetical protein
MMGEEQWVVETHLPEMQYSLPVVAVVAVVSKEHTVFRNAHLSLERHLVATLRYNRFIHVKDGSHSTTQCVQLPRHRDAEIS